jgi:preprotein translocase subunit SecG
MTIAMLTLMIVAGLTIILLVYIQSGHVKAAGSSITNAQDLELFENKKIRGAEKALNIGT